MQGLKQFLDEAYFKCPLVLAIILQICTDLILVPVPNAGKSAPSDSSQMEFEAKSARDGAWSVFLVLARSGLGNLAVRCLIFAHIS